MLLNIASYPFKLIFSTNFSHDFLQFLQIRHPSDDLLIERFLAVSVIQVIQDHAVL